MGTDLASEARIESEWSGVVYHRVSFLVGASTGRINDKLSHTLDSPGDGWNDCRITYTRVASPIDSFSS